MLHLLILAAALSPGWNCQLYVRYPQEHREVVERAVRAWTSLIRYRVCETTFAGQDRTIDISFQPAKHGDPIPLSSFNPAHSFPPGWAPEPLAGDIHFLETEDWRDDRLYNVALHEVGCALGVPESPDPASIMYGAEPRQAREITPDAVLSLGRLYRLRLPARITLR